MTSPLATPERPSIWFEDSHRNQHHKLTSISQFDRYIFFEYPYLSASLSMNPSRVKTARSLNATVSTSAVSESLAQFSAGFDNLSPVMYLFGLILINTEDALLKCYQSLNL